MVTALKCAYIMFPSIDAASKILYKVEGKFRFNGATFQSDFYPTGHKSKSGTEAKEGNLVQDWICDRCDYKNFARRLKCHKCDNPRNQNCKVVYNSAAINMRPSTSYQPNAQYLAATMYGAQQLMAPNLLNNQYRMANLNVPGLQTPAMGHEDPAATQPSSMYANTSLMIRGQQLTRITETEVHLLQILDIFNKYAPVKDIRLVRNKQSGQLRDFAFEADRVLQQVSRTDFRLLGQPVMVAFSRSKPKRDDETISMIPSLSAQQSNYFMDESMDNMLIQEAINQNQQLSSNYDYSQQQPTQSQQQQSQYNYSNYSNYENPSTFLQFQTPQMIQQQVVIEQQQLPQPVIQEEIIQPPQPPSQPQPQSQPQIELPQIAKPQESKNTLQPVQQKNQETKPQEQEQNTIKQKALLASVFAVNNELEEEKNQQQPKRHIFKKEITQNNLGKGPKTEAETRKIIELQMKKWEKEESQINKQKDKQKYKMEKQKKKKEQQQSNQLEILMFSQKDPDQTVQTNDSKVERIKIITSHSSDNKGLPKLIICTICRRKFQCEEILRKHELFSELHKNNIEKQKKEQKVK